jgi:hypothetical protein
VLAVFAQIFQGALQILPTLLANTGAVLLAVSFFRGETTLFTNGHQLVIFISGTLSPILGIALMYRSHRRADFDQRELATLFTLLLFTIAYFMRLSPYVRGLL